MYLPTFTITNKMLRSVGAVEAAKEIIENAPLVPAWENKFRQEAIIRTVHHGTHIEGNELNFDEAKKIIEAADLHDKPRIDQVSEAAGVLARDRDIQEVLNYRNVLRFVERFQESVEGTTKQTVEEEQHSQADLRVIAEAKGKITQDVVLYIHELTTEKMLPPESSGALRKTQVVVKNSRTGEITFRPPPALEVPYLMKDLLQWVNATSKDMLHPVLKAGVAHYEFVRIHPFLDGNGRVSRAIATLVLFLDGYDIKRFFSIEEYYDKNPFGYYESLQNVEKKQGDLTGWLEYFSEGIAIELSRVKEKVKSLSRDIKLKKDLGGKQVTLTERQLTIIEYMQKVGFIQNKTFFEVLPMVSEDTVLRDLTDMMKKGVVRKEGSTKGARYVLTK